MPVLPEEPEKEDKQEDDLKASKDSQYMAEQIEMFNNKISAKKGQSRAFNSVTRDDKSIAIKYYGEGLSPGHVYYPNPKNVQKKELSNVKMVDSQTERRVKKANRAECLSLNGNHTCSYKVRSILRDAKISEEDYDKWTTRQKKAEILKHLDPWQQGEILNSTRVDNDYYSEAIRPGKEGIINVAFSKQMKRPENILL